MGDDVPYDKFVLGAKKIEEIKREGTIVERKIGLFPLFNLPKKVN